VVFLFSLSIFLSLFSSHPSTLFLSSCFQFSFHFSTLFSLSSIQRVVWMGVYLQEEGCCRLLGRGKVIFFFSLHVFIPLLKCGGLCLDVGCSWAPCFGYPWTNSLMFSTYYRSVLQSSPLKKTYTVIFPFPHQNLVKK